MSAIRYCGIRFEPRTARRHNKLGIVGGKNAVIYLIVQRLLKHAEHAQKAHEASAGNAEMLSRAKCLRKIMSGGKNVSSFELAEECSLCISNLSLRELPDKIVNAHREQVARCFKKKLDLSRLSQRVDRKDLKKGNAVYYFKRKENCAKWETGYVRAAEPQFLSISSRKNHKAQYVRAAYEDVRSVPKSLLLRKLNEVGYLFPKSSSIPEEHDGYKKG